RTMRLVVRTRRTFRALKRGDFSRRFGFLQTSTPGALIIPRCANRRSKNPATDRVEDIDRELDLRAFNGACRRDYDRVRPPRECTSYIFVMINAASVSEDLRGSHRNRGKARTQDSADRLPPHADGAEQGVLGCIMISPNECMGECVEKLKGGAEAF